MKIGIDARFAVHRRRGIGNYVLNLVRRLAELDRENSYILYTDAPDGEHVLPGGNNFTVKRLPPFYPFTEQAALPMAAARDGLDILHCTGNTAPLFLPGTARLVLTLHDAAYMKSLSELPLSPSAYQRMGRLYRRMVSPRAALRAAAVVTVSDFARKDILAHMPFLKDIEVTPLGTGDIFRPMEKEEAASGVKRKYGIEGRFLLAVGGVDPQKNTAALLRAFSELGDEGAPDCTLAVAGISSGEPRKGVRYIGFAGAEDMPLLYNAAEALVFPSLKESFGLPPLEAMACGIPVIASRAGAIPEVTGDAALLVDPRSPAEIKAAMRRVLSDPGLRKDMSARGIRRAGEFSWERTASSTLKIYEEAVRR